MPVFSKIATTLSAVLALTSAIVHAAPLQPAAVPDHDYKLSTHRRHAGANNVEFVSYHPPSSYKTFHDGDHSLLSRSTNATRSLASRSPAGPSGVSPEVEEAALSYLAEQTGLAKDTLQVRSGYTNDIGVTHVYLHQLLNGIPVTNGVANVSFDKNGKVVAFGSNMVKPDQISPATPALPEAIAIQSAVAALGIPYYDEVPATLSYVLVPAPSGTDPNRKWAMLTHQFQLRDLDSFKWVEAYVDATKSKQGDVVQVVNFVADAAYRALDWSKQDPEEGLSLITDPQDAVASSNGWHSIDGTLSFPDTKGNNALSYSGPEPLTGTSEQTGPNSVFDYQWDPSKAPEDSSNKNAAVVNAFYVANKYHDVLYKYGFIEEAFNFQINNFNKGGLGEDGVLISVQDASGKNNANFAAPPDGAPGICRMYTFTFTDPNRDGALENDIVTHELTHGLTNRMTGGGTSRCLQTLESGGMGEGWSDTVAFWSEQKSETPVDFTLGGYVTNKPDGIRSHPYSTDMNVNPLMYADLQELDEVHNIGEVWAMMLIEVYWALVTEYGFNAGITNVESKEGNIVFLHLLVDALAIQPCNPTFVNARDAIIQADQYRYGGEHYCTVWRAFATRGLGFGAAEDHVNEYSVPPGC